jgi:hypothetical protein
MLRVACASMPLHVSAIRLQACTSCTRSILSNQRGRGIEKYQCCRVRCETRIAGGGPGECLRGSPRITLG